MKSRLLLLIALLFVSNFGFGQKYVFYLHNKFPEEHDLVEKHPEYGRSEYLEILNEFKKLDFVVLSEKRPANTDVKQYARKVTKQIDSLLSLGVNPNKITVIGTSKGGYIAQYVSTFLANPNVNFIFIGCYQETDLKTYPDINFCGNILTINEKSDYAGVSAIDRKKSSKLKINEFKEVELNTNLKHGFLFRPLKEWIDPSVLWVNQNYQTIDALNQRIKLNPKAKASSDMITMYDSLRNRIIPVAIYSSQTGRKQEIVIFNHGYGYNKGGDYLAYSYLTEYLAAKGYFVASIQHEITTDSLLPLTGIPPIVRKPFWERGVANIMFVINQLKKTNPQLDFSHITLIGHSNGGDMVALFPKKYPNTVNKIITLDNRRMALPRKTRPRVYSLRSSDQLADEGVLPTSKEQGKFKINVIKLLNTPHHNMDDSANDVQREEIRELVMIFLNQN